MNPRAEPASRAPHVEALGQLAAGVAHEFNNLLGVISNSAYLMERHPQAADLELPLGATRRAVQAGQQLTQHLLRFAGRREPRLGPVALDRALPEALHLMAIALGRRVELQLKVAADTAPVRVDGAEMELALVHLAFNARHAMRDGGSLQLAARNARADDIVRFVDEPAPAGRMVLITVRADGTASTPAAAASDPGLGHVRDLCNRAGGAVRVVHKPGWGTTVVMLLPASAPVPPPGPASADGDARPGPRPAAESLPSIAGKRILLVDDCEDLADVTAMLLSERGAHVARAGNADEALRLVAAQPFDAVLSDIVMPGELDGLALARRLRQLFPAMVVVLISGDCEAAVPREFPFLCKPAAPEALMAVIASSLATPAPPPAPTPAPGVLAELALRR